MASGAWTLEELTVSDVFAPQTAENLELSEPFPPKQAEQIAPHDNGGSSTGFRMTAEVSPTRNRGKGLNLGNNGNATQAVGNSKKKKKNKRRQNPGVPPEPFIPSSTAKCSSTDPSIMSKGFSPRLLPLHGPGKSPALRPTTPNGGISALKMQLDALNLTKCQPPSSNASVLGSETETSCANHEKLYLILEYAQGGELFTHLAMERMFTEDVAAFYMAELVLALEHLHHNIGVIYRDLKPENCLLDTEGHLLLTDFGLSKVALNGEDRCNSSLGTVEYMAPEVIQGKPYGKACDWWSLGALGFDLLTGSPPFKGNNNARISEKIIKQKLVLPYFLGPDAKDLLTRLLRKEPNKRLGSNMPKDINTIKNHRFFRKIDWKALERRELDPPIRPVVTDPALAENFSADFTTLPLSPVVTSKGGFRDRLSKAEEGFSAGGPTYPRPMESNAAIHDDPFGGFSFVAPSSLLDSEYNCGRGCMA
ncbi:serine/threonine-protein kinase psk1 [Uncinocarpus reesii 1704]|uniref:Serine/threonine-protein kinase psk1 n=1 Tax=Uncinocarpus reesii (strain UAMH 1704) TaxID=336963 RepID=C4JYU7_UNCRE|nr:serine/threonine-protein kinase psk1 [Uncinocarpus reesii 1704]EEP82483.1 serine/threonine-protein kinase psk1 [Uncinocarpus reesii 1704]